MNESETSWVQIPPDTQSMENWKLSLYMKGKVSFMSQITDNYQLLSELPFVAVTEKDEIRVISKNEDTQSFKPRRFEIPSKRVKVQANQYQETVGIILDAVKMNSQPIEGLPAGSVADMMLNIEIAAKRCSEAGSMGAVPVAIMSVSAYEKVRNVLIDGSKERVYIGGIKTNLPFYPIIDRDVPENNAYVFMCPVKGQSENVVMPMPLLRYCEQGTENDEVEAFIGVAIPENFVSFMINI